MLDAANRKAGNIAKINAILHGNRVVHTAGIAQLTHLPFDDLAHAGVDILRLRGRQKINLSTSIFVEPERRIVLQAITRACT